MMYLALMSALLQFGLSDTMATPSPNSCGKASCYLLCRQLGVPVTYESLDSQFARVGHETSFADLARVLGNLGVPVTGLKMEWDDFKRLNSPAIVRVILPKIDAAHFHVASRVGNGLVILDPLRDSPIVLDERAEESYRQAFSGYVLVPSASIPRQFWFGRNRGVIAATGVALAAAVFFLGRRLRFVRGRDSSPVCKSLELGGT
jgi:hypothetical protein